MIPNLVMKFGGTSVKDAPSMQRVVQAIQSETRWPVVVVSALGGVTDMLLQAAALAQQAEPYEELLAQIHERHDAISRELSLEEGLLSELKEELGRWLQGVSLLRELSPRVKDALLSLGERMSVRLLAALLRKEGLEACAFDSWGLGLVTDDRHTRAAALPECLRSIRSALEQLKDGTIPVVTGFIGRSLDGEITTFGRGGGDFSAAVFGAAAHVEEIQIWTDVPGFLRADPRVVDDPQQIRAMQFEEAAELAYFGAKVLHPRTLEPARRRDIPVRVLGTFHVDFARPITEQGTLITNNVEAETLRAVAIRQKVDTLHISSLRMLEAPGFLARVFGIFARYQISVDVIATSEVSISMTFDQTESESLSQAMDEIREFAQVEYEQARTILCLVGAGLRQNTSLVSQVFTALSKEEVPIHVISQGASRINLTLVTEPPYGKRAMRALYEAFFLD
jgi:aspartate kinase